MKTNIKKILILFGLFIAIGGFYRPLAAQTPGQIFSPASGSGRLVLDPNGDGFVSIGKTGFAINNVDYNTTSQTALELNFRSLPVLFKETENDQKTGGAHTDMYGVRNGLDGHEDPGAFLYSDGTNLLFRMRLVGQSTASKGYSFLFDTTLDGIPNYEVILRTGGGSAGIQIYDAAGNIINDTATPIPLNTNFQRVLAGVHEDEQRYYYDFYVPWGDSPGESKTMPFAKNQNFRTVALTITAASGSYLTGATVGDIGGVDDSEFGSTTNAIGSILSVMPVVNGDDLLEDGDGFGNLVSAVPSINSPVMDTQTSVSGTSIESEGTTITLRVYADADATTPSTSLTSTVTTENTWEITALTLTSGQQVTVSALATQKDPSVESARVTVQSISGGGGGPVCTPAPLNSSNSGNRFIGTIPGLPIPTIQTQVTIRLYSVLASGGVGTLAYSTLAGEGVPVVNYTSQGGSIAFAQNSTTGDVTFTLDSGSGGNIYNSQYYVTAQRDGYCMSDFAFDGTAVRTEAPVITTNPIPEASSQSISGTSTEADGTTITVFRNDDDTIIGTSTVSGANWTATISAVVNGDQIYARATNANGIVSGQSNIIIVGVVQTDPPTITGSYINNFNGNVTGYTEEGGSHVRVFRNGNIIGELFSNAFGVWSLDLSALSSPITLATNDVLTADALATGNSRSELSTSVTVLGGTTPEPAIYGGATSRFLSAMGTEIDVSGSGTIRIYIDGDLVVEGPTGGTVQYTQATIGGGTLGELIQGGVEIYATRQTSGNTESEPSNVLTVIPDPVRYITSSGASPEPVPSGGGQNVVITYQVLNNDFAPEANVAMIITKVTGEGSITAINGVAIGENPSYVTDDNGRIALTYTTSVEDDDNTFSISAVDTDGIGTPLTVTVSVPPPPSVSATNSTAVVPSGTAGSLTTITITIRDDANNPVTLAGPLLSFSVASGPNAGASFSNITEVGNGVYTMTYTPTKVGDDIIAITLNTTPNDETPTYTPITNSPFISTVVAGALASFEIKDVNGNDIGVQSAGTAFEVRIRAVDGHGNIVTSFFGTVTLTSTGTLTDSPLNTPEFTNGVLISQSVSIANTGSFTLNASDGGDPAILGTSNAFRVNAGEVAKIEFSTPNRSITAGGVSQEISVQLLDSNDNITIAGAGGITLGLSSSPAGITFRNVSDENDITSVVITEGLSTGTFLTTGTVAGVYTITVSADAEELSETQAFTVNEGVATKLVIETIDTQTAGADFDVTVTLTDVYGNPVNNTGADGTVTLSVNTGTGSLGGTIDGIIEVGSSSVTISGVAYYKAETGVILTATGTGDDSLVANKMGNSSTFNVLAGAATQILVETHADGTGSEVTTQDLVSGSSITVYAISRDESDNFVGLVTDASWSLEGITGGVVAGDLVAADLANGSAVFTGALVGTAKIQASKTGLIPVESGVITVVAGAANNLAFIQQPTSTVIGADITPSITVEILDVNGNRVTNNTSSVTLSIGANPGSGALSGTVEVIAIGGVVTFTDVSINKVGEGYTLSAASGSLTSATSSTFNMTAKTLTIAGTFTASNKVYDGNTSATVDGGGLSFNGLVSGTTSVTLDLVGVFDTATVDEAKTVSLTGTTLTGTDAANYTLSFVDAPTASANITAKALTITGLTGADKVYDGNTTATATGTATLSGVIGADVGEVTLGGTPVYTFASADVANGIEIFTTGYTISGAAAGNYSISQPTLSANITRAIVIVTPTANQTKVYGSSDPVFTYTLSADVTVTGVLGRATGESVGSYAFTLGDLSAGSNYSLELVGESATFDITAKSLAAFTVDALDAQTYTGSALTPSVVVKDGTTTLVAGTDYELSYADNTDVGTATVTITGAGNYSGSQEVTFDITAKSLAAFTVDALDAQTYTGSALTPSVVVKDGTTTLVAGTDYELSYADNTDVGTATVTITGAGNYSGSQEVTFDITAKSLAAFTVDALDAQTYTGSALTPSVVVKDGTTTLVAGTDYELSYADNTDVGTATVTITGAGNYSGSQEVTFDITAKSLAAFTVDALDAQTYTGSALTPSVVVKDGTTTLVAGTDYELSYADNTDVGTATVTITGAGNYSGSQEVTFDITAKSLAAFTVDALDAQTYTGSALTPSVVVKDGTTTLVAGTDYELSYADNTDVGTATVTITGAGNYSGSQEVTFDITAKSLAAFTVDALDAQTYTGSALTPSVVVKDGTTTLVAGTDYELSYADNTDVGTATVTITGAGNYSGSQEVTFDITAKSLAAFTVDALDAQTYTGSALTPSVVVKDGTTTLVAGTDYELSYADNTDVGTATVTITGAGNYSGSQEVTFDITAKSLAAFTVDALDAQTYTGSALTPSVVVKDGTTTLVAGTDYEL
jgi:hypothetical protein